MADDIMAQMGFGVADEGAEDRMRGVAKQLRGDRNLGNLFQFSGNQAVRDAGKGMSTQAQRGIENIGTRRAQGLTRSAQKARDEETRRRSAYSEARDLTQDELLAEKYEQSQLRAEEAIEAGLTADELENKRAMEAAALKHENAMAAQAAKDVAAKERSRIKAAGAAAGSNRMGSAEKRQYRESGVAARTLPDILAKVEATPDAFGANKDIVSYLPDWTPNMATEGIKVAQNKALSDEEQQARDAVYNQSYQIINSLAGAALSIHEKSRIEAFTPSPNDDARTVANKLKGLMEMANRNYVGFAGYADYVEPDWLEDEILTEDEVATVDSEVDIEAEAAELAALEAEIAELEAAEAVEAPRLPREPVRSGGRSRLPVFVPSTPQSVLPKARLRPVRGRGMVSG